MDAMDCLCDVDFISKTREHFVGLSGKYIYLDGSEMQKGEDKNFCYSAFVIEIRGVWCLVTAGDGIEKIDAAGQPTGHETVTLWPRRLFQP